MREDHRLDVADSLRDGRGEEHGDCRNDSGREEQGAKDSFFEVKFLVKEEGHPRTGSLSAIV